MLSINLGEKIEIKNDEKSQTTSTKNEGTH